MELQKRIKKLFLLFGEDFLQHIKGNEWGFWVDGIDDDYFARTNNGDSYKSLSRLISSIEKYCTITDEERHRFRRK